MILEFYSDFRTAVSIAKHPQKVNDFGEERYFKRMRVKKERMGEYSPILSFFTLTTYQDGLDGLQLVG